MLGALPGHPIETPWARPHAGHHETAANSQTKAVSMIGSCKRHLTDVGESYFEHLAAALGFSARLLKAGTACALHAVVPALCRSTASRSIEELHSKLAARAALSAAARRVAARRSQAHERSEEHRYRIDA